MKKSRFILIALVVLALAGYLLWGFLKQLEAQNRMEGSGTIQTTEIQVGSLIGGRVIRTNAREGDFVKPGDVLVTLDPYQLPAQRQQLMAELAQAEAVLIELQRGPRPQEIEAAEAQYREALARANLVAEGPRQEEIAKAEAATRQAQADLEKAQATYLRFQTLYERHVISDQEFDEVRTNFRIAQEQLAAAQEQELELKRGPRPQEITAAQQQARALKEQYDLLKAGTRPEEIAAQEARIQTIKAQLAQLEATSDELSIQSTCHCQVSSLDLRPGQLVNPNQTVATLINLNDLWVRVYIPEERFGLVQPGDPATVRVDPYPKRTFAGTVIQVASRAEFTPRNVQTEETRKIQVFGVKVQIDNTERLLRPGMPADVTFDLREIRQKREL